MSSKVLLVDDENNVLSALTRALLDEPFELVCSSSGEDALKLMESQRFKVIVSDEMMPGMGGAELLSRVRAAWPDTLRIMLTGHATLESAIKAVNQGEIYRFFTKPWDDNDIKFAIRSAIEKYDLEAENRRLLATVRSQAMEIKVLERRYPGISRVEKDVMGSFILPDLSEEEFAKLIEECEKECR